MSTPSPSLSDIPLVEQRCSPTPRITLRLLTYLFGTRFLTRESLRDDLILIAILFPMSLAPFPLAAASGKSRIAQLIGC
ncbi:hypothetical protein FRC02_008102 [Tulasnella sp. 418]|nr:hypothetical protein FRC02_008102 [Tulasnella sp. 418]